MTTILITHLFLSLSKFAKFKLHTLFGDRSTVSTKEMIFGDECKQHTYTYTHITCAITKHTTCHGLR